MFTGRGFHLIGHGLLFQGQGFFSLGQGFFFLGQGFFSLGQGFFSLGQGLFFLGHGLFSLGQGFFFLGHGLLFLGQGFFFLGRSVFQSRRFRFLLLSAGLVLAVAGQCFLYGLPHKLLHVGGNRLPQAFKGLLQGIRRAEKPVGFDFQGPGKAFEHLGIGGSRF
jgi:hypothetical protein